MKHNTIKWKIFKYNILVIVMLITLAIIIFNIAVRTYFEKDIRWQLSKIADSTANTALKYGRDFLSEPQNNLHPVPNEKRKENKESNYIFRYYFMLDRTLKDSLTVLNADFMLLDKNKNIINHYPEILYDISTDRLNQIINKIDKIENLNQTEYVKFNLANTKYIAIIKPVFDKNTFGLGWIIIYSSLEKVNQMQIAINIILFSILIVSALIIGIFSSYVSKKISAPFTYINDHIKDIAARNFGYKIDIPVDEELQELVYNINIMSEKLETYDKAQKTFLQNVSHEFRTPLMSIQSYAEGIKYDVVDSDTAVNIIIDETNRMTNLVEDLLYLSRLDAIEENYYFEELDIEELINSCVDRMTGIATKSNIKINASKLNRKVIIYADEEKLSHAIINIISNCIRYAKRSVTIVPTIVDNIKIRIDIYDDGSGFEKDELPNIFERFYKGRKGNFGLGLSISKNVIERHKGRIMAENSEEGALFIIELPI